jgi:hypothetical protein
MSCSATALIIIIVFHSITLFKPVVPGQQQNKSAVPRIGCAHSILAIHFLNSNLAGFFLVSSRSRGESSPNHVNPYFDVCIYMYIYALICDSSQALYLYGYAINFQLCSGSSLSVKNFRSVSCSDRFVLL